MNLADAIRRASQGKPEPESVPALIAQFEDEPAWQEPADHEVVYLNPEEQEPMHVDPEPAPEPQSSQGASVRLELFLSPDQLSNLFRAVAANQHTMLTLREAASYLRVGSGSLEQMAHDGEIPAFLIDGKWRFSKAAIDEWLTAQQQQRKESA